MSTKKKALLFVAIIFLSVLLTIAGILAYCLASPERTKELIQKAIGDASGLRVTAQNIDYTFSPLHFTLQNVMLNPVDGDQKTEASISEVAVDLHREGSFGHKKLVIDSIRLYTPALQLHQRSNVPAPSPGSGSSSRAATFVKGIAGLFLFREIEIRKFEVLNGNLAFTSDMATVNLSKIRGQMNTENRIEIACELRTLLTEHAIAIRFPDLHITTKNSFSVARPDISADVTASHATIETPWGRLNNIDINSHMGYEHDKELLICHAFEFKGKGTWERGQATPPCEIEGKMGGVFDLRTSDIHGTQLSLSSKDFFSLQGTLAADFRNEGAITLEISEGSFFPSRLRAFLPEKTKTVMETACLGGAVQVRGTMEGIKSHNAWNYLCDMKTLFTHNPVSFSMNNFSLEGDITGAMRVEGEALNPAISADITASDFTVESPVCSLSPCSGHIKIGGRFPGFTMNNLTWTMPEIHLKSGKQSINMKDVYLSSEKGFFDFQTKAFRLPLLSIDSAALKHITLQAEGNGETCRLSLEGVNTGILEFADTQGFIPKGWKVSGSDTIRLSAEKKKEKCWGLKTELHVDSGSFEDAAAVCIGEDINAAAFLHCLYEPAKNSALCDGSVRVTNGEVLFDRFYLDLGTHTVSSNFKGTYGNTGKTILLREMNIALRDRLSADVKGRWIVYPHSPEGNIHIRMHEAPVLPLFETFVREPFKAENPALESITAEGTASASFHIEKGRTGTDIRGHFYWKDGALSYHDAEVCLTGLTLDLPLWIHAGTNSHEGNLLTGKLDVQSIQMPFLTIQALSLPLQAKQNSLHITSSTMVATSGGPLRIGPVSFLDLAGPHPSIHSDISIQDLDIGPFIPEAVFPDLKGTIGGRLDPVRITQDVISTEGNIVVDVWGGKVVILNIAASSFFSGPLVSFDARLDGLDLAEMTTNTSFGKVEGTLQGHIKGLEIAYGQPQKFDLLLETTPRKGVTQKISVKAVENIAKIGGGQSPFVGLAGVISSFFKEFPYEKIGVRASLQNDIFSINGTIKEDETEYIIKRGGFSGVNIVNQNPDNQISFKDMVKRIKRITKEGASPVIE